MFYFATGCLIGYIFKDLYVKFKDKKKGVKEYEED